MIWLYRSLYPLVLPVLLPGILLRMKRRGGYRHRFGDRFGLLPPRREGSAPCVWVQAVSVGEVLAVEPLLRRLAGERPDLQWWVTTTTSTGFALARERLGDLARIGYFPLDWWPCSALAWSRLRPSLVLLAEGEVWPEHLWQARRRGVARVLLNGRLSDRSFRRYQRAGPWTTFSWSWLTAVLAVSDRDARRIRRLAGPEVPVQTTGNLKFDVDLPGPLRGPARRQALAEFGLLAAADGEEPLVLLGSSTWPGEEELLVRVARSFLAEQPGHPLRLVLVPRHAERSAELREQLAGTGLPFSVRSADGPCRRGAVVYLADTTGELRQFTALADLVFIGKSLPPHRGGQTPIEGAAAGRALVSGPDLSNFRTPSRGLEAAGGLRRAASAEEAESLLLALLRDEDTRATLGAQSRAWYDSNHGACERMAAALHAYLPAPATAEEVPLPALRG
jgi:3-deoxy-D-manno-octulosonic-acid transferase